MNELAVTKFQYSAKDLTVLFRENNEPWFKAQDVAEILEHSNSRKMVSMLKANEKIVVKKAELSNLGLPNSKEGNQNFTFISEPGLYKCILRSETEASRKFQDWVCHEVLPNIRKQGFYGVEKSENNLGLKTYEFSDGLLLNVFEQTDKWIKAKDILNIQRNSTMGQCKIDRFMNMFTDAEKQRIKSSRHFPVWYVSFAGLKRLNESTMNLVFNEVVDFINDLAFATPLPAIKHSKYFLPKNVGKKTLAIFKPKKDEARIMEAFEYVRKYLRREEKKELINLLVEQM